MSGFEMDSVMTAPVVQIALVSEQSAPNLLPAMDPDLAPSEVILLVTEKMRARADALQHVLKENGKGVVVRQVLLEDERDMDKIEETLLSCIDSLEGKRVCVNLTGGTKLMALAVSSVADAAEWEKFYVDIDTDQIVWLKPKKPAQLLSRKLRLRHYLQGYGLELVAPIERPQPSANWSELTRTLIKEIGSLESAIGQLNFILHRHGGKSLRLALDDQQLKNPGLDALLRNFDQAGLLELKGKEVIFSSEEALTFAHGGWMEHHVFQCVQKVTGALDIKDVGINVKVRGSEGAENEVDVMFLARNRLHLVECKTARMDDPSDQKANNTLYKIAEIRRRIGGIGAKSMLVSYRELSKHEMRLAAALNIKVLKGRDLQRLEELLRVWINQSV